MGTARYAAAQPAGCFALSGVSSVPAISAAAVKALSEDFSEILVIETVTRSGNGILADECSGPI
jgi:hypothetical protein